MLFIHPVASIHRDADARLPQARGEGEAGQVAALVGVEGLRRAVARQGLLQLPYAETRVSVFDTPQVSTRRLAQGRGGELRNGAPFVRDRRWLAAGLHTRQGEG